MNRTTFPRKQLSVASLALAMLFCIPLSGFANISESESAARKIDKIVATAESYLGTPHKWGGMSRSGIDCSGLMVVSFASVNYRLPRISRDQANVGSFVRKRDLRRGDLIFFKQGSRIDHVGLVTESHRGKVRFIHTSSSKGVMVSDLDSHYWDKHYQSARRIYQSSKKPREPKVLAEPAHQPPPRPAKPQATPAPAPRTEPQAEVPSDKTNRKKTFVWQPHGTFPEASQRVLSKRELKRLSTNGLVLMKDEIYARYGYRFRDKKTRNLFERMQWYQELPKVKSLRKVNRKLSKIEKKNLKKIDKVLKKR